MHSLSIECFVKLIRDNFDVIVKGLSRLFHRGFRFLLLLFFDCVLVDKSALSWFGFDFKYLRRVLLRRRLYPIPFEVESKATSVKELKGEILNAVRYHACDALECQLAELNDSSENNTEMFAKIEQRAGRCLQSAQASVIKYNPAVIVYAQGYNYNAAALRYVCHEGNIPFLALENTACTDRLLWEDITGITVNRNMAHNYFWRYCDNVAPDEVEAFHSQYIKSQKTMKSEEHRSPDIIYSVSKDRPMLTWLGQVYTDSSVLFGLNHGFHTPVECIRALLAFAVDSGCRVFLKMHPKEVHGVSFAKQPYACMTSRHVREDHACQKMLKVLGEHVVFDDKNEYDTYSVLDASDLVATVNSQAGLEAAIRGIPVCLFGHAFYAGLGFTRDVYSAKELNELATILISTEIASSLIYTARKFNYIFLQKYCIPKTVEALAGLVAQKAVRRRLI